MDGWRGNGLKWGNLKETGILPFECYKGGYPGNSIGLICPVEERGAVDQH